MIRVELGIDPSDYNKLHGEVIRKIPEVQRIIRDENNKRFAKTEEKWKKNLNENSKL